MMNKAFPIISILFLAFLALGFQSCTPAAGLLYNIEREKVLAVTNSAINTKVSTGSLQKYGTLLLVKSGTGLYARTISATGSGWSAVNTNGKAVVSFAASGTNVYVVLAGNTGGAVGDSAALFSTNFTTMSQVTSNTITWTPITVPLAAGESLSTVLAGNANDALVQTTAKNLFYCTTSSANAFGTKPNFYVVATAGNYLLDQGCLYTFSTGPLALTLVNSTLTALPNIVANVGSYYTGLTTNGANVYLSNINGTINFYNGATWSTSSSANGIPLTGIQYVNGMDNKAGGTALASCIVLTTRDRGPMSMDTSLALKTSDPLKLGNFSSTNANNMNGVYFDNTDSSSMMYFTTMNKGLFSAIYNPTGQVSANGFTFTWE